MERKLKQIVMDWRKAENDDERFKLMKMMQALLFRQKEKQSQEKKKTRPYRAKQSDTDIKFGEWLKKQGLVKEKING